MIFEKEDLRLLAHECHDKDVFENIENEIVDTDQWESHHCQIFKFGGRYYRTNYTMGLTEQQDVQPYENDYDEIECEEVFALEKTVTYFMSEKEISKLNNSTGSQS